MTPLTNSIEEILVETLFGKPRNEDIWQYGTEEKYYKARIEGSRIKEATQSIITKVKESLPEYRTHHEAQPTQARAYADGYNQAIKDMEELLKDE
jgi:predicted secreted Zn-dependent protease